MLIHLFTDLGPELSVQVSRAWQSDWMVHQADRQPGPSQQPLECDLVLLEAENPDQALVGRLEQIRSWNTRPDILVFVPRPSPEQQATLLRQGCSAVLDRELSGPVLAETLHALIQRRRERWVRELQRPGPDSAMHLGEFMTRSPQMREFMEIAAKVCQSDSSVLALGETGVGKERLAEAIHSQSGRREGPFVVVNCGAIPETLMESELFGFEKGAFTGANRTHRGHFECAQGGTIFLDEIGEMPVHLQVKLLRVLQAREVQRVGAEARIPIDVRVIAATHRDLLEDVKQGSFRADLYYRLSVVVLRIPPLRERTEDIMPLAEEFRQRFAAPMRSPAEAFSETAQAALTAYPWPGNVRELMNVIERAVLLSSGPEIGSTELPQSILDEHTPATPPVLEQPKEELTQSFDEAWLQRPLAEVRTVWNMAMEKAYLQGLLAATQGRVGLTAERAGIDPRSLYTKMRRHGLRKEDYRGGSRIQAD